LETDQIATHVVDAAFAVHSKLGPGLLESVYEICLAHELERRGLKIARQLTLPIIYGDLSLDSGLRLDMLVGDSVVVELKAVEKILPIHYSQLLTYLKLSGHRLGLLINFNTPLIKDGITRLAI
jgi:GxxExxY protein